MSGTIIYGPDSLTVGADTELHAYNAGWVKVLGSVDNMNILNADDFISVGSNGDDVIYRYTGTGSPTGDQLVGADCKVIAATYDWAGAAVRVDASGNCYVVRIGNGNFELVKVSGNGATWTRVAGGAATFSTNTMYAVTLQATGTSTTALVATMTGQTNLTYNDSSSPYTSGYCGLYGCYQYSGIAIDNPQITDLAAVAATPYIVNIRPIYSHIRIGLAPSRRV
jgi:hypothetical protein